MKQLFIFLLLMPFLGVAQNKDPQHPVPQNALLEISQNGIAAVSWEAPDTVANTHFYEGFEDGEIPAEWILIDQDGDGNQWEMHLASWSAPNSGQYSVASYSWYDGNTLTPDNWLISPSISVPDNAHLRYYVAAISETYFAEHYQVRLSTTGTNPDDFTEILIDETLTEANTEWTEKQADISAWAGETVHIAFVHNQSTDLFALKIDDISVNENTSMKNPQLEHYSISRVFDSGEAQFVKLTNETTMSIQDTIQQQGNYYYLISAIYDDGVTSENVQTNLATYYDWLPALNSFSAELSGETVVLNWDKPETSYRTIFYEGFEDFENLMNWDNLDFDGDNMLWEKHTATAAYEGTVSAASYSWFNGNVLAPNNWLISNKIPLSYATSARIKWAVSGVNESHSNEYYQVRISNSTTDTSNLLTVFDETLPENDAEWKTRDIDISDYLDDSIHIAFVHQKSTDVFAFKIDDVSIEINNPVVGYNLYRKASGQEAPQLIITVDSSTNSYIDPVNVAGDYTYYIAPVYENGGEGRLKASEVVHYTGLKAIDETKFNLYPNPLHENALHVSAGFKIQKAVVCSMLGETLYTGEFNSEKIVLNFETKNGIYVLKIYDRDGAVISRVFVKD